MFSKTGERVIINCIKRMKKVTTCMITCAFNNKLDVLFYTGIVLQYRLDIIIFSYKFYSSLLFMMRVITYR